MLNHDCQVRARPPYVPDCHSRYGLARSREPRQIRASLAFRFGRERFADQADDFRDSQTAMHTEGMRDLASENLAFAAA